MSLVAILLILVAGCANSVALSASMGLTRGALDGVSHAMFREAAGFSNGSVDRVLERAVASAQASQSQRALLFEENLADPKDPKVANGRAVWRLESDNSSVL